MPNTPYDTIVEHAIQFERAQELEKNLKKPIKRKVEEIDLVSETYSDTECSKPKSIRQDMEKQKQDFGNTLKQFKDSISSRIARLEPLVETVNNLSTKEPSNSFNNSSRY